MNRIRARTPQEKKKLSLQKDRRNVYGESPHGSRKSIPRNKKFRNRANRHEQDSKLPATPARIEDEEADAIESSMRRKAPKQWKKRPDAPLGEVIDVSLRRRVTSYGVRDRLKVQ